MLGGGPLCVGMVSNGPFAQCVTLADRTLFHERYEEFSDGSIRKASACKDVGS